MHVAFRVPTARPYLTLYPCSLHPAPPHPTPRHSYFEVNQKGGVRWNTSKGFLHPVRAARPNLTVRTRAHVTRVLFDEKRRQRATGVEFFVDGQEGQLERATAGLETVLSAGAVGSPQLLQLSGVGPAALLREKGFAQVVLDAPGVGADLQDHIQIRTVYRVEGTRTLNDWYASLLGRVEMALRYAWDRSGPLSMAPSQLGVFAGSDGGQKRANLEYHVQPLSLDRFGEPLHTFPAITAGVVPLQPTSRGSLAIQASDPRSPPVRIHLRSHTHGGIVGRSPPPTQHKTTDHPAQLPGHGGRPKGGGRRHPAHPAHRAGLAGPRALQAAGAPAHPDRVPARRPGRGAGRGGGADRHYHFPSLLHVPHGEGRGPRGGVRRVLAGARPGGADGGGRVVHAAHHERQHQQPHHHDRGEGGGLFACAARDGGGDGGGGEEGMRGHCVGR